MRFHHVLDKLRQGMFDRVEQSGAEQVLRDPQQPEHLRQLATNVLKARLAFQSDVDACGRQLLRMEIVEDKMRKPPEGALDAVAKVATIPRSLLKIETYFSKARSEFVECQASEVKLENALADFESDPSAPGQRLRPRL